MNEMPFLCAFVSDANDECEAMATFSLTFGDWHIEACDEHLAALAHGIPELYAVDEVRITELAKVLA